MEIISIFIIALCLSTLTHSQNQTLRHLADTHHIQIGSAVNPNALQNEMEYYSTFDREFNSLTPENAMKWPNIENQRGQINFRIADDIVSHAQKHGQKVRGHTLVWHNIPNWVSNSNFTASELKKVMDDHIFTEVTHFKGKIYAWDVINEALAENGSFRNSIWHQKLGTEYIADALKVAHEADPNAKLYINDYNVEGINSKSTALYNLVRDLKNKGVPIHGVGLQAHFQVGHVPTSIQQNMKRFVDLGVEVAITELDIRMTLPVDTNKLNSQANDYKAVVKACRAVSKCVGITVWGFTDKYSWVHGEGAANLFDEHYKPKPAYYSVRDALA